MLLRRDDWAARLHQAVEAARRTPFGYGSHDCLLFAATAVLDMTGVDLAAEVRGTYHDAEGAAAALAAFAGGGMIEAVEKIAARHAIETIPWQFARRGDVVLVETVAGPALGVCVGAHAAVAALGQRTGIAFVGMSEAMRAYRIG
jgi:hypothetical protein